MVTCTLTCEKITCILALPSGSQLHWSHFTSTFVGIPPFGSHPWGYHWLVCYSQVGALLEYLKHLNFQRNFCAKSVSWSLKNEKSKYLVTYMPTLTRTKDIDLTHQGQFLMSDTQIQTWLTMAVQFNFPKNIPKRCLMLTLCPKCICTTC